MTRALMPYESMIDVDGASDRAVEGLANSALAQVSPETVLRLRGALWRAQVCATARPALAEVSSAAADCVRMRVQQFPNRTARARFEIEARSRGRYAVSFRGYIEVD